MKVHIKMLKEVYAGNEASPTLDVILYLVTVLDYLVADILQVSHSGYWRQHLLLTCVVNSWQEITRATVKRRSLTWKSCASPLKLMQYGLCHRGQ